MNEKIKQTTTTELVKLMNKDKAIYILRELGQRITKDNIHTVQHFFKQGNKINKNKINYNFKNARVFYKFLINSELKITKKQYKKIYNNLKGKLSSKKKNINLLDYCNTNKLFILDNVERNMQDKKINQKFQNIKKLINKDYEKNEKLLNDFWVFFYNNNLKNKYNKSKKYLELFFKNQNNKNKLEIIFKPFLKNKSIKINEDFIFKYYNGQKLKTITKPKDCLGFVNQKQYLEELHKKYTKMNRYKEPIHKMHVAQYKTCKLKNCESIFDYDEIL